MASKGNNKAKVKVQKQVCLVILAFAFGFLSAGSLFLSFTTVITPPEPSLVSSNNKGETLRNKNDAPSSQQRRVDVTESANNLIASSSSSSSNSFNILQGVRILIAIASFDFSQLPHLEEVLDGYQDLCTTGASKVDVIIHTTVPYPVTLIDLLNSRLIPGCIEKGIFSITIVVKSPAFRLHLVDCHRALFYEKLDKYDLFIYTEDDIRVTPRAVAAYLEETIKVEKLVGKDRSSDFNVGIVRYEYNFPSNVVIDDKTRHATQNVTRVYWEHSQYPVFGKAIEFIPEKILAEQSSYVTMKNHHQGMFLATRDLLKAWKIRKGCNFHEARNRPGMKNRPSQPSEGTQRVWMSSQMLYGGRHCGVQQVLPVESFGSLTVLHLPNKNYRRVGHFRNRTFSDGTEKFDMGVPGSLLTAMRLHIEMRQRFKRPQTSSYAGIQMVDECSCQSCEHNRDCSPLLPRRMEEFRAYIQRGGILTDDDMTKIDLV